VSDKTSPKKYFWLKLKEDFFTSKEIKKLRKVSGGDTFVIIYLKMQLLSIKQEGYLKFDGVEDSFAEEIALEIDEEIDNVKATLIFLVKFGLVDQMSETELVINEAVKNIGTESESAERVRLHRQRKSQIALLGNGNVTKCNTEIEKDLELEKEKKFTLINPLHSDNERVRVYAAEYYKITGKEHRDIKENFYFDNLDSEGIELNESVRKYEAIVAPSNYKRPKAIFTQKMLDEAKKKLEEMGLIDSLGRRYATLDDITVNNILFANRDSVKKINGSVFDDMKAELAVNAKTFDKVEEISISDFIKDVLPTVKNMEVLFDNKHSSNMVSLIAPKVKGCKTMFKWDNGFSWAYSGNVTDSMKERVKAAGGKVDGVLRFSIQWNEALRVFQKVGPGFFSLLCASVAMRGNGIAFAKLSGLKHCTMSSGAND